MKPTFAVLASLALGSVFALAQDDPQLSPRVTPVPQRSTASAAGTTSTPRQAPAAAPAPAPADPVASTPAPAPLAPAVDDSVKLSIPAGTKIPLTLKQGITTRNARVGDPVYAQTVFPITQNNSIVIPAGTFVQGTVRSLVRPGHVKGRAQLQMSFTSMIFPNGYTIMLPATVDGMPGSQKVDMKGTEGTIQQAGTKGKDAATVLQSTLPGAAIGAIAGNAKGAGIGAATGGVVGLATVLLTRGPDIQLDTGSSIEMVLERTIELDHVMLTKQ